MRLTSFTDFGLRMLMRMAGDPSRAFSSAELAADLGLSRNHLAKIIQHLARAGLIDTRRGGGGGAMLARPAAEIRLGQIIRLLEEGQPLVECFDTERNRCVITPACKMKGMIAEASRAFYDVLGKYTIAEVCAKPEALLRHLGLSAP